MGSLAPLGMTGIQGTYKGRSGDPDLKFNYKQKPVPDRRFFPQLLQIECHPERSEGSPTLSCRLLL
jgi:hypothetical protein